VRTAKNLVCPQGSGRFGRGDSRTTATFKRHHRGVPGFEKDVWASTVRHRQTSVGHSTVPHPVDLVMNRESHRRLRRELLDGPCHGLRRGHRYNISTPDPSKNCNRRRPARRQSSRQLPDCVMPEPPAPLHLQEIPPSWYRDISARRILRPSLAMERCGCRRRFTTKMATRSVGKGPSPGNPSFHFACAARPPAICPAINALPTRPGTARNVLQKWITAADLTDRNGGSRGIRSLFVFKACTTGFFSARALGIPILLGHGRRREGGALCPNPTPCPALRQRQSSGP